VSGSAHVGRASSPNPLNPLNPLNPPNPPGLPGRRRQPRSASDSFTRLPVRSRAFS
jgi:hypothetical protein